MKNPFEWFHSLYYGERLSLQDFDTKNPASLDALLKQIFMTGHKAGKYRMKNSLPAFNAAYYVAACLFNISNSKAKLSQTFLHFAPFYWKSIVKNFQGMTIVSELKFF